MSGQLRLNSVVQPERMLQPKRKNTDLYWMSSATMQIHLSIFPLDWSGRKYIFFQRLGIWFHGCCREIQMRAPHYNRSGAIRGSANLATTEGGACQRPTISRACAGKAGTCENASWRSEHFSFTYVLVVEGSTYPGIIKQVPSLQWSEINSILLYSLERNYRNSGSEFLASGT